MNTSNPSDPVEAIPVSVVCRKAGYYAEFGLTAEERVAKAQASLAERYAEIAALKRELSMAIDGLRLVNDKASLQGARMVAREALDSIPEALRNELSK